MSDAHHGSSSHASHKPTGKKHGHGNHGSHGPTKAEPDPTWNPGKPLADLITFFDYRD